MGIFARHFVLVKKRNNDHSGSYLGLRKFSIHELKQSFSWNASTLPGASIRALPQKTPGLKKVKVKTVKFEVLIVKWISTFGNQPEGGRKGRALPKMVGAGRRKNAPGQLSGQPSGSHMPLKKSQSILLNLKLKYGCTDLIHFHGSLTKVRPTRSELYILFVCLSELFIEIDIHIVLVPCTLNRKCQREHNADIWRIYFWPNSLTLTILAFWKDLNLYFTAISLFECLQKPEIYLSQTKVGPMMR